MTDSDLSTDVSATFGFMPEFQALVLRHLSTEVTDADFKKFRDMTITPGQRLETYAEPGSENMSRKELLEEYAALVCTGRDLFKGHIHNATKTGEVFIEIAMLEGQPILFSAQYGVYCWALSPEADEYLEIWLSYPAYPRPDYDQHYKAEFENLALTHALGDLSEKEWRRVTGTDEGRTLPDKESRILGKSVKDGQLMYHVMEKVRGRNEEPIRIGEVISEPVYYLPDTGAYVWSAAPDEYMSRMIHLSSACTEKA